MKDFPTMLRKMWSGGEVQEWLDRNPSVEVSKLEELMANCNDKTNPMALEDDLQKLIDDHKKGMD